MDNDRLTNPEYVWNQLDYKCDAIIEASAGTGKTYALESIVLKLICDEGKKYDPREILLVTFTDKAAGELRNRIRKTLDEAGKLPPGFDEMTICTIHSFCRQLLSEYAFENGVPMQCEVGNDSALAHQAVLEALKDSEFANQYEEGLFTVMDKAGLKSIGDLVKGAEELVKNGGNGEQLRELSRDVDTANAGIRSAWLKLSKHPSGKNVVEFILEKAGGLAKDPAALYEWLKTNFSLLSDPSSKAFISCLNGFSAANLKHINPGIASWDHQSVKKGNSKPPLFEQSELADYVDSLRILSESLAQLKKARKSFDSAKGVEKRLSLSLATLAESRFEELKKSTALLTFDDMVARAAAVVTTEPETEEERDVRRRFLDSVREHYRVALVDEFQDTDDKQWGIFRTLFSAENNNVKDGKPGFLLVVGDPKQSIYSFRGADVGVYCKARDEITAEGGLDELGKPKCLKSLTETYRSKPTLVDAFNTLFSSGWFANGEAGKRIEYENVKYPEKGNGLFGDMTPDGKVGLEEREPAPVLLLESMPDRISPSSSNNGIRFGNAGSCLPVFMESAVAEMNHLVGLDWAYRLFNKKTGTWEEKRFRYGDMCVLVATKNDAAMARRVLAKHGIPYGQYKQQGLYDSAEAEGVLALLDYLVNPNGSGNRAALLLSPLFGIHPAKLSAFDKFPEFDALIESLQDFAGKKKWNELFERVMSSPCTALASPRGDVCAFNRTRAAVRQLFDKLLSEKGRLATTLADFAAALRSWRKDDKSAGEDGALYKKESDADRVKIMTMHASKGLQFPIVFLASGFANPIKKGTPKERKPTLLEESRRLFYVALTRAMHRLYLPWSSKTNAWTVEVDENAKDEKVKEVKGPDGEPVKHQVSQDCCGLGSAGSPLLVTPDKDTGFLGKAIKTYFTTEGRSFDNAFPAHGESKGTSADAETGDGAAANDTDGGVVTDADGYEDVPDVDVPEDMKWFGNLRLQWDSFSSLPHSKAGNTPPQPPPQPVKSLAEGKTGGGNDEADGESLDPAPEPGKKKSLLPSGNVSGSAFHEIMEELCNNDSKKFEDVADFRNAFEADMAKDDSPLLALIRKKMRKFSIRNRIEGEGDGADSTEKVLLRMVRHALDTVIDIDGHPFKLREIPRMDRLAEVEFVGSEQKLLGGIPDNREGALNGAIDLLVRKDGRVYIIDWKTNTLQDYGKASVDAAMEKAGYRLQYRLYALAADAWLKGHGLTLTGAAYLFVRGGENGTQSAVYKELFGGDGVERFRKDISSMGYFGAKTDKENKQ